MLVGEGEAELDDAEEVDVAAKRLVVVVAAAAEGADRTRDNAGELGVLCAGVSVSVGPAQERLD